jgi:hypothetical protein
MYPALTPLRSVILFWVFLLHMCTLATNEIFYVLLGFVLYRVFFHSVGNLYHLWFLVSALGDGMMWIARPFPKSKQSPLPCYGHAA